MVDSMEFLSKCRLFWKQLLQRYARPSEQFNLPLEVFFTILLLGVFYRLKLAAVVSRDASLLPELGNALSWSLVLQFLSAELLLAIFVSAIVWLCLQLLELVELGRFELWLRRLGMCILLALLFTVSFLDEAHVRLVESMQVGLTWESFVEGAHGFSFMAWIRYITLADPAFEFFQRHLSLNNRIVELAHVHGTNRHFQVQTSQTASFLSAQQIAFFESALIQCQRNFELSFTQMCIRQPLRS